MLPVDKVFKVHTKFYNSVGSSVCELICILKIIQAIHSEAFRQDLEKKTTLHKLFQTQVSPVFLHNS